MDCAAAWQSMLMLSAGERVEAGLPHAVSDRAPTATTMAIRLIRAL